MKDSRISWTDHTHNPWIGCTKVSPGCENCYAAAQAWRHKVEWGAHGKRRRLSDSTLRQPLTWNRAAEKARKPAFVFCASLADVFDNKADPAWRADLFATIRATPWLVWLLLTKRPQNIRKLLPPDWGEGYANVWLGTTAEDQTEADRRLPVLAAVPARVRFVSAEPLLERISLAPWLGSDRIGWVICGAESGPKRRPFDPDWARRLRDECVTAGAAFFHKQEIGADGKKVETPPLDGRRWTDRPTPERPPADDLPLLTPPAAVVLDGLADRLNAAHQAVERAVRDAVARGVEFGKLLIEAKAKIGHGRWEEWVATGCAFSVRSAQGYMRLARELPKLDPAKAQRVADLSLREAMAAVATDARNVRALPEPASAKVLEAAPEAGLRQPLKRAVNEQKYRETLREDEAPSWTVVETPAPFRRLAAADPVLAAAVIRVCCEHAARNPALTSEAVCETLNLVYCQFQDDGLPASAPEADAA